jgi:hypothetical protein
LNSFTAPADLDQIKNTVSMTVKLASDTDVALDVDAFLTVAEAFQSYKDSENIGASSQPAAAPDSDNEAAKLPLVR